MKKALLYVMLFMLVIGVTAKPFKVTEISTVSSSKTDTLKAMQTFGFSYRGDIDTAAVVFEGLTGSATLDTLFISYLTMNGGLVSKDTVTSFTTTGKITRYAIKLDKKFPPAVKLDVLMKYTTKGKCTGKLYYITY